MRHYFKRQIKIFRAAALSYPSAVTLPINVLRLMTISPWNTAYQYRYIKNMVRKKNLTTCLTTAWNPFIAAYLNSFILGYIFHPLWPSYILV